MRSVRYERDDTRRRVVVTVEGTFTKSEMLTVIDRQRAEGTWNYGVLYDLRCMTGQPTLSDLGDVIGHAESHRPTERPRGPVAILTTHPILYDLACAYAALGRLHLKIQVFRDIEEGHRWLAAEIPRHR